MTNNVLMYIIKKKGRGLIIDYLTTVVESRGTYSVTLLSVLVVYLLLMIVIGKLAGKRVANTDDYLVAGRKAPLFITVGTIFATFWGGGTIVGATGAAYNGGIYEVIQDPFAAGLALIIAGLFFVVSLRKQNIRSVGSLYAKKYGKKTSYYSIALMLPTYIMWTAVQLLAISKIMYAIFGISMVMSFTISIIVIVTFTYLGGMLAVAWTDTMQVAIIIIGLFMIMIVGIDKVGGVENINKFTPDNFWNILPRSFSLKGILGYIALWLGMALGNIPSPDLAQRAFMAKSDKTAKSAMIISGILYWTVGLVPVFIALIAITLVGQGQISANEFATDSELLIPIVAKYLLNPFMLAIFISSLVAAILSSASSSLFATSVMISNDLYGNITGASDKKILKVTKYAIFISAALSVMIGAFTTQIFELTIFAFSLQFGMLFFPFVCALKSKYVIKEGVVCGMSVALFINVIGCILNKSIIPEPYTFYTLVPAIANFTTIYLVTYIIKNKRRNEYEIT